MENYSDYSEKRGYEQESLVLNQGYGVESENVEDNIRWFIVRGPRSYPRYSKIDKKNGESTSEISALRERMRARIARQLKERTENRPSLRLSQISKNVLKARETNIISQHSFIARIVEIHKDCIELLCLIDKANLVFENRIFDSTPFKYLGQISVNGFIEITITVASGSKNIGFKLIPDNGSYKKVFDEPKDYFSDMSDDDPFFKSS